MNGNGSSTTFRPKGKLTAAIFVFTLTGFVVESQLTQYVQTTLGYRQPYFLFYVVHSSFFWIFPIHILYLKATLEDSVESILQNLISATAEHLDPHQPLQFPYRKFLTLVMGLTLGVTTPSLLWFTAVTLASITDVTAIWNTNAFFAYVIAVKFFDLQWDSRRLAAVVLATLGTTAVVYGGSGSSAPDKINGDRLTAWRILPSAPLVGDLMTLVASVSYGLYQVLYKKYAALPSDPEVSGGERPYTSIPDSELSPDSPRKTAGQFLPFGLHPNLLTSAIGLCTFLTLWVPIPFVHYLGGWPFAFPANWVTVFTIGGIALGGVVFNAGFMILLWIWGPIITSVGGLLTIVLVLLSDVLFGSGVEAVTLWSLIGSGVIVAAFAVLAYDTSAADRD